MGIFASRTSRIFLTASFTTPRSGIPTWKRSPETSRKSTPSLTHMSMASAKHFRSSSLRAGSLCAPRWMSDMWANLLNEVSRNHGDDAT